jgi:hypothetical protein
MISQPWVGLAEYGSTKVGPSATFSGTYWCIVCLSRVEFTTLVDASSPATSWAAVSLAAGVHLYGYFTDGTISLGVAICYKAKP